MLHVYQPWISLHIKSASHLLLKDFTSSISIQLKCPRHEMLNRTWIQELQLHDSFSLMEKSRSSDIQEMKFALAQKSSDSFCNTLKLNDNTYAGFQIYKNVPLPESTLTWGENWRRWKNAGGKIPWIQNARYLSCIFQSCKMLEHLKHSTYKSSKHAPPTCTG